MRYEGPPERAVKSHRGGRGLGFRHACRRDFRLGRRRAIAATSLSPPPKIRDRPSPRGHRHVATAVNLPLGPPPHERPRRRRTRSWPRLRPRQTRSWPRLRPLRTRVVAEATSTADEVVAEVTTTADEIEDAVVHGGRGQGRGYDCGRRGRGQGCVLPPRRTRSRLLP